MRIIELDEGNLQDFVPLFDAYRQFYGRNSDLKGSQQFIQARVEQQDTKIYIAIDDAAPVGFIQLYFSLSSVSAKKMLIINDLYTHPTQRRRGVGTLLVERAIKFSNDAGYALIKIETQEDNKAAQALYEQQGFVRHIGIYSYFQETPKPSVWRSPKTPFT